MTLTKQHDTISLFIYGLGSPETRKKYRSLKAFFDSNYSSISLEVQAEKFVSTAKHDKKWAENSTMKFKVFQKQRCKVREIRASTFPNYSKPIKLI